MGTWHDLPSAQKGYGRVHRAVRAQLVACYQPGVTLCAIGGEPLSCPPSQLDLAHNETRTGYKGLACWKCNRGDAGRKGAGKTRPSRQAPSLGRVW